MKLSNNVSTLMYIILGVVLALSINQGLALALSTDMPVVAVESNSMVPTFYKGDILVLQGVPSEDLQIGDIIVFSPENYATPIVHRITEINPDGTFQTKGDANLRQLPFEKKITPEQIHGKVIFIVPYLGWVKIGMTDYVIPNILWVIVAIIIIYGSYYIFVESKRK
jgi:signal peptidase